MANRRDKERQEETVSAQRWTDSQQSGANQTVLAVPAGTKMFKAEGDKVYKLDVIAYRVGKGNLLADPGMLHFERTYFVHYNIGVNKKAYCCLKQFNKACPVCNEWERKKSDCKTKEEDKKLYQMYSPKKRQLWNVIDTENKDKGIQIWDVSFHLFGKALVEKVKKADEEERDAINSFADPRKGMTLRISTTKETANNNAYVDCSDIEFKTRKEQYDKSIIDEAYCLDSLVREFPFDVIESALIGEVDATEDDDDKPKGKKGAKPSKPAKDDDDDDDDEDEDDDDDDKPAKKPAKKPVDDDDDEDDDDKPAKKPAKKPVDDDDDEDDDDKPAKKPAKKPVDDDDDEDDDDKPAKKPAKKPVDDDDDKENNNNNKEDDDDDEEDDDEDEEDDDDDDEDDKPAKKPGKKPSKKDDDDEDDDKPSEKKPSKATAESLGIKLGTTVTYKKAEHTVVKITDDGATLTLEDEDEEIHRKIPVGDVEVAKTKKPKK